MTDHHRSKMAPAKDAPQGLETDAKGNVIPFERRTKEDQEKAMSAAAAKLHGTPSKDESDGQPPNTTAK
jgi:hypothetical protein